MIDVFVSELRKINHLRNWRYDHIAFLFSENRQLLHDLAFKIGLHPYMFNNDPHFPHYRLSPHKYYQAINSGAIAVDNERFRALVQTSTACVECVNG